MQEAKKWTYDTEHETTIQAGQYIASIGKGNRVVSVWLILSACRVQHKQAREYQGWRLEVVPAPDQKAGAEYDPETNMLWVRGEEAHPFYWYPRSPK